MLNVPCFLFAYDPSPGFRRERPTVRWVKADQLYPVRVFDVLRPVTVLPPGTESSPLLPSKQGSERKYLKLMEIQWGHFDEPDHIFYAYVEDWSRLCVLVETYFAEHGHKMIGRCAEKERTDGRHPPTPPAD